MRISVLLATYNQPKWLEKCLCGYASQLRTPDEIVIADDGSDERTRSLIGRMQKRVAIPLRHVWHEDDGFRKCTILNRAIEHASGDYLVMSDGDCIPRADFLDWHERLAERRTFLSGGYYKLTRKLSHAIAPAEIRDGRAFDVAWLRDHGLPLSHRMIRLAARGGAAAWLDRLTTTRATWNGNNASAWAADIWAVGGFDERMQYGGLDRELGERLHNAGVRGKQIRHRAVCLHLDHERGYANPESWRRNKAIRAETRRRRIKRTLYGLDVEGSSRRGSAA